MAVGRIAIGTAGWTIPAASRAHFPGPGAHLVRYARRLAAVEINSTFYRSHRISTFERWANAVPDGFRFAVKMPREIAHERRLVNASAPLDRFLGEIAHLGERLGPVLVQLPPALSYRNDEAHAFFSGLRDRFSGDIALEPRHASWFTSEIDSELARMRIARVAADPAKIPGTDEPAGWPGLIYYRLHGSPRIYYSAYSDAYLDALAERLAAHARRGADTWCIFDNTASGAAAENALSTRQRLAAEFGNG